MKESELQSFPKPNFSKNIITNKPLVRAVSTNNIQSSSNKNSPVLPIEPPPPGDTLKIKELTKQTGQGYMKETLNSKIKQKQTTEEGGKTEVPAPANDNPSYITVPSVNPV